MSKGSQGIFEQQLYGMEILDDLRDLDELENVISYTSSKNSIGMGG